MDIQFAILRGTDKTNLQYLSLSFSLPTTQGDIFKQLFLNFY